MLSQSVLNLIVMGVFVTRYMAVKIEFLFQFINTLSLIANDQTGIFSP